tara:strand:- start:10545 stop:10868 length:324 start_codon:yes stop_codon:yes gene_type:complete
MVSMENISTLYSYNTRYIVSRGVRIINLKNKTMNKVYQFLGGRKMTLAILLFIVATILLWVGKSNFAGWSNLIIWVFGTYAVGNVGEHLSPHLDSSFSEKKEECKCK